MPDSAPVKLELGCGTSPTPGYIHHDRIKHADYVDLAWDLRDVPWPFSPDSGVGLFPNRGSYANEFIDEILALDVFEHVSANIQGWLDECWRLLKVGGKLDVRLPAWDHQLSYRDPTHLRVFHPETFHYWDPERDLHRDFGAIYFAESNKWWRVHNVWRENNDFRYVLIKRGPENTMECPVCGVIGRVVSDCAALVSYQCENQHYWEARSGVRIVLTAKDNN